MSLKRSEKGLLTPDNCVVALIDHQPQMLFGVSNFDRQSIINNTVALAKAARVFSLPVVLSTVESKSFSGNLWPQIKAVFPNQVSIDHQQHRRAGESGEGVLSPSCPQHGGEQEFQRKSLAADQGCLSEPGPNRSSTTPSRWRKRRGCSLSQLSSARWRARVSAEIFGRRSRLSFRTRSQSSVPRWMPGMTRTSLPQSKKAAQRRSFWPDCGQKPASRCQP